MANAIRAKEILAYLDQLALDEFPMFDNANHQFIAGRLNVYRDEHSWAIVFCTLSNCQDSGIITSIYPISPQMKMVS